MSSLGPSDDPAKKVSRPFGQIWALPPSTNSSIPVTKLESSEARNNATLATSSGSPMRPIGTVDTILAITSADCSLTRGVDAEGGSALNTRDGAVENDRATIIQ